MIATGPCRLGCRQAIQLQPKLLCSPRIPSQLPQRLHRGLTDRALTFRLRPLATASPGESDGPASLPEEACRSQEQQPPGTLPVPAPGRPLPSLISAALRLLGVVAVLVCAAAAGFAPPVRASTGPGSYSNRYAHNLLF